MFSVTSTVLHRALAAEGIDPAPTISVPFDARRFLPSDFVPLGNFAAGLDFRVGTAPTPRIVHEALTEATATGRPVANLMVNSLRIRSGLRRGIRPELPTTRPRHPRARMLFSSLRRGVDRLPWLDLDRRFYATHTAPTGPEGITFTTSTDGSFMHVVTAFHDTVFPPDLIRAALRRATAEPLGLLTGAGPRLRGEP